MHLRKNIFTKIALIVLAALSMLTIILVCLSEVNDRRLRDNLEVVINNPVNGKALKLPNFKVYNQLYSWSCGPTTISMVYTFLKEPKDEKQILVENKLTGRNKGMTPAIFEKYLINSLQGYDVKLMNNISDSKLIQIIYNQLSHELPVPVYFSTVNDWDKPNYDTHYSVVIGIDMKKATITIANAYGFEETVNVYDFLDSLKYSNYKNMPIAIRLAILTGVIQKNNIYVIHKY